MQWDFHHHTPPGALRTIQKVRLSNVLHHVKAAIVTGSTSIVTSTKTSMEKTIDGFTRGRHPIIRRCRGTHSITMSVVPTRHPGAHLLMVVTEAIQWWFFCSSRPGHVGCRVLLPHLLEDRHGQPLIAHGRQLLHLWLHMWIVLLAFPLRALRRPTVGGPLLGPIWSMLTPR